MGKGLIHASLLPLSFFFFSCWDFLGLIIIISPPKESIISNPPDAKKWKGKMSVVQLFLCLFGFYLLTDNAHMDWYLRV